MIYRCFIVGIMLATSLGCSNKASLLTSDGIQHASIHSLVSISVVDNYVEEDGYYIFFNKGASNQKLIFFLHGLGAINPAIYGKWIKHMVELGSVVVYPRYQKSLFNPLPSRFDKTISHGLLAGLEDLKKMNELGINYNEVYYFGHSYGAAAALYFGVEHDVYDLPKPKSIFACQPGTGFFSALSLEDYGRMDMDIEVIVLSSENDKVVGNKMAQVAFVSVHAEHKAWIEQFGWKFEHGEYKADHRSPYSLDVELDNKFNNVTYKRAKRTSDFDEEDFEGFFKISQEILTPSHKRTWLFKPEVKDLPINQWAKTKEFTPFAIYYK